MKNTMLKMTLALVAMMVSAQERWTPESAIAVKGYALASLEAYASAGVDVARDRIPDSVHVQLKKKGLFPQVAPGGQPIFTENGETVWVLDLVMPDQDKNGVLTPHPRTEEEWRTDAGKAMEQLGAYATMFPVLGVTELRISESGVVCLNPKAKRDYRLQSVFAHSYRLPMAEFTNLTQAHPDHASLQAALVEALRPVPHRRQVLQNGQHPKLAKK